jgi:hypothetical protein
MSRSGFRSLLSAGLVLTVALVTGWPGPARASEADRAGPGEPEPSSGPNTLTNAERAAGWRLLFDGSTTSGWRGFRQAGIPAGWQVVDGALTRVAGGGDVITTEQFANFELLLEWRIAGGGNSGIMFRVSEVAADATHLTGPEMQVLDNARAPDPGPLGFAGACYGLYAPSQDVTRPAGSWNAVRLIVNGSHVEHWLNGVKIVEYELGSAGWLARRELSPYRDVPTYGREASGYIALQDHGDRVAFRSIKLRAIRSVNGDLDGDQAADLALFRPANGDWMFRTASSGFTRGPDLSFGLETDKPVPGDYDADGRVDMAVYRPSDGMWYVIYSSTGALAQLQWGVATDIPMQADYTGDGRTDLCVWRPSTGIWYIFDLSTGTYTSRQWGVSTDIPLTGDYDGDALADVAVFRPSNGFWYLFFSSTQTYTVYQWGIDTDIPLPADYTGDGRTDLAVYRPSTGFWFVYDLISTDMPAPKDHDGDGRTDLAVWRPSTGTWFIYFLASNTFSSIAHGANGDVPIR